MSKYTIEKHGKGYAIYLGRDWQHHGANIGHLTEVTPATIKLIENKLNATLTQTEQEPVAWLEYDDEGYLFLSGKRKGAFPVFIAPPSKPWVSLTDEEIDYIWGVTPPDYENFFEFPRAIEAKLKEKNT